MCRKGNLVQRVSGKYRCAGVCNLTYEWVVESSDWIGAVLCYDNQSWCGMPLKPYGADGSRITCIIHYSVFSI